MVSEFKIRLIIIGCVAIAFAIPLILLSIVFAAVLANNFSILGLFLFVLLGSLTIMIAPLPITMFKTLAINARTRSITVTYFGTYSKTWRFDEIKSYRIYDVQGKYGMFEVTLIETNNGEEVSLSENAFKNYSEMRDMISSILKGKENNKIKTSFWKYIRTPTFWFLILWILTSLISRMN